MHDSSPSQSQSQLLKHKSGSTYWKRNWCACKLVSRVISDHRSIGWPEKGARQHFVCWRLQNAVLICMIFGTVQERLVISASVSSLKKILEGHLMSVELTRTENQKSRFRLWLGSPKSHSHPQLVTFIQMLYADARYWYSKSVCPSVRTSLCPSVRLSVTFRPVSDKNGLTYRHSFFSP